MILKGGVSRRMSADETNRSASGLVEAYFCEASMAQRELRHHGVFLGHLYDVNWLWEWV